MLLFAKETATKFMQSISEVFIDILVLVSNFVIDFLSYLEIHTFQELRKFNYRNF